MLDDALKRDIQTAYSHWLDARGFRGRRGQRQMIAEIARAFGDESRTNRLLAIEAGTGTGKTVAYLLAALPIARAHGWRLVISTATLALQEQLVARDLPDLAKASGMRFSFELAKGRGRYVCPQRLEILLANSGRDPATVSLFNDALFTDALLNHRPEAGEPADFRAFFEAFVTQRWDGHRDSWPVELKDEAWRPMTTDHRACGGPRCKHFKRCPYFIARQNIDNCDVVIANHDLVMADLALGGGVVLPAPEDALYIFDEAHHLAEKAQSHFSLDLRVRNTTNWIEGLNPLLATLQQRLGRPAALTESIGRIIALLPDAAPECALLESAFMQLAFQRRSDGRHVHRFVHGRMPAEISAIGLQLAARLSRVDTLLQSIDEVLQDARDGDATMSATAVEEAITVLGGALRRMAATLAVLGDVASAAAELDPDERAAPRARWIALEGDAQREDIVFTSTPVAVDGLLRTLLWDRCQGALLTSATLVALDSFAALRASTGLPADAQAVRLASPFDYARQGELVIPFMRFDGGARDEHTDELVARMPGLLDIAPATLVLFTSWRQMNAVYLALPKRLERIVLRQGDLSRGEILRRHHAAIDASAPSAIFGLASFAEGIDLPGAYCTHVIIAKLPFPVPDDPLFQGLSEWLASQGRDSFNEVSVPHAALRLVQACGRLIRNESDHGRVTLLDRRIVTKRYGRQILESLPPFQRAIESAT